jgi:hypothetical protein
MFAATASQIKRTLGAVLAIISGAISAGIFIYGAFLVDATYVVLQKPDLGLPITQAAVDLYKLENGASSETDVVLFKIKKNLYLREQEPLFVACGVLAKAPSSQYFKFQEVSSAMQSVRLQAAIPRCYIAKALQPLSPDFSYELAAGVGVKLYGVFSGPTIANRETLHLVRKWVTIAAPILISFPVFFFLLGKSMRWEGLATAAMHYHFLFGCVVRVFKRQKRSGLKVAFLMTVAVLQVAMWCVFAFVLCDLTTMLLIERPAKALEIYGSGICQSCTLIDYANFTWFHRGLLSLISIINVP